MVIAADSKQARTIMRYCLGLLREVPMLAQLIESETQESIDLRNRVTIEVHAASFRTTRGYTIVAALVRRDCVLARGRQCRTRPRSAQCLASRHGDDPERDVAVRVIALCPQGRAVRRLPQTLRQGWRRIGVAGRDAGP